MDDRQKQLVAAGEAMRKWIQAQRATWAAGYPQSLSHIQPQFAGAAAAAIAFPQTVMSDAPATPAEASPTAERGPSWSEGVAERVGSTVQGTATLIRLSWKMLAAVAAVVLLGVTARYAWPSMKSTVASRPVSAPARDAAISPSKPSPQRATGTKPAGTAAGAAVATTSGIGRLQVESSPTGAHVEIDGKERGVTPLTVEGLTAGSHKVVVRGNDGSVQRTVAITAGETAQLSESIYSGWLHVSAPFDVQLSEGQKPITLDDSNQVLLSSGPHDVRFENRTLGLRQVRHIDIRPGETTAISLDTPMSHLTVTATEPATVSIDGQQVGETPLTEFAVPVGSRDVTVTSASGVVRHQTITLKVQPSTIEIDFAKP